MRTSQAIDFYGGSKQALADALGIRLPSIYDWGEFPPPLRQIQLQQVTGGRLKAEPDVFVRARRVPARDEGHGSAPPVIKADEAA